MPTKLLPLNYFLKKSAKISLMLLVLFILSAAISSQAHARWDLLISQLNEEGTEPFPRGGNVSYSIITKNQLDEDATSVRTTFPIPVGTSYVSLNDNGSTGCTYLTSPDRVQCNYGTLAPNDERNLTVTIKADIPLGTYTYTSSATVESLDDNGTTYTDDNPANNTVTQNTTITDAADLTTTLVPNRTTVSGGNNVIYTATVTNNGPNNTSMDIEVVFQISAFATYVNGSASGTGWNCSYDSGTRKLSCTRSGGLNLSASAPGIQFTTKVTDVTGSLITTATIPPHDNDPNPNNNVTTNNITVTPGTDLAITITASPSAVIEENTTTITLFPRNNGAYNAEDVSVVYTLPTGFSLNTTPDPTDYPGWTCDFTNSLPSIICTRSSYNVGATDDIVLELLAPAYSGTSSFANNTTISTSSSTIPEASDYLANNSATTSITLDQNGVDLQISKIKSPDPVAKGSAITTIIYVTNNGPLDATTNSITVTDTIDGTNEVYSSGTGGSATGTNWSCTPAEVSPLSSIQCTYTSTLTSGSTSEVLTIVTNAAAPGLSSGSMELTNTANVTYSDTPGDYDNTNDEASAAVTVTALIADLVVTKTADRATLAADENVITYTIDICNNSPPAVGGITLTDSIISGYYNSPENSGTTGIAVTASPANYTCTNISTGIRCTLNDGEVLTQSASGCVTPNVSDIHRFEVTFARPLNSGVTTNRATAYSSLVGDFDRSNNEATESVTVEPQVDLEVRSKTVTPNPVKSGVEATWVVTVYNRGPSMAENVIVRDTFTLQSGDPGFTIISVTPSQGSCTGLSANTSYSGTIPDLDCSLGNLNSHESQNIQITIRPNYYSSPPDPREINNSATILSSTTEHINPANNSIGPITLTVEEDLIDLLINNNDEDSLSDPDPLGPDPLGHNPDSAATNTDNDIVYKVDFTNNGPSYATGVEFDFAMSPADGKTVQFLCDRDNPTDARSCSGPGTDNCSLTSGANPVTGSSGYGTTLTYTCNHGDLAATATAERYLTFRVISEPEPGGDTHKTLATVRANENENITSNNQEAEDSSVRGKVDLEVTGKLSSPSSIDRTEAFDWTISLINHGPSSSRLTVLTDDLGAHNMELYDENISCSNDTPGSNGGLCSCSVSSNLLTCNLGTIERDDTVTVVVPVKVDGWYGSPMDNCVTVVTDDVESDKSNNENVCGNVTISNQYHPSDYGDAPDGSALVTRGNYETRLNYGGARHYLDMDAVDGKTPYLGSCVDADGLGELENNSATADDANGPLNPPLNSILGTCIDNDDEDGVSIPVLIADSTIDIDVTVSGASCNLNGWIDFNQDGDWNDAGEHVLDDYYFDIGAALSDTRTLPITIPAGIVVGDSYARFRCATETGLTPTGSSNPLHPRYAEDGEVEDYMVSLQPKNTSTFVDYGDAPDPGFPTLLATDGASHIVGQPGAPILGDCVDSDSDGQPDTTSTGDDTAGQSPGGTTVGSCDVAGDDEDGIIFTSLIAGENAVLNISVTNGPCTLNGWIDYNRDGDWNDPGEQVFADASMPLGINSPSIAIANDVSLGTTTSRFRCTSAASSLGPRGAAPDGEVEDYQLELLGYISGQVRMDADANGLMADADGPIAGVTIQLLDNSNSVILTTTTDNSGNYLFNGLHAGNYTVVELDPLEHKSTNDSDGGDPSTEEINRISVNLTGLSSENNDFIDTHLSSLGDLVWFDTNKNGIQDFGERGTAGITVNLYKLPDTTTPLSSTTTDGNGYYTFPSLITGEYLVEIEAAADYTISPQDRGTKDSLDSDIDDSETDPATTKGRTATITLPPGTRNTTLDAGISLTSGAPPARLSNLVWYDIDQDGIQDTGEPGIAGVLVTLFDAIGTPLAATRTNGLGHYSFAGLPAGNYRVEFIPVPGYTGSPLGAGNDPAKDSDADPSTGLTGIITLQPGENNPDIDAGFFLEGQTPASLGDYVWFDSDKDGIQDSESGIGGIKLSLSTSGAPDTILSTTTTAGDGSYTFSGLVPGIYFVTFTLPDGYSFSTKGAGTTTTDSDADPATRRSDQVTLLAGQHDPTIDGGLYITDDTYVSIGDLVWVDTNYNNTFDIGEGVEDVTLVLYDQFSQEIRRTVTDNTGAYLFSNLPPGDYYVVVNKATLPAGVHQLEDPDTTLDSAHHATNVTTDLTTVDFGYEYRNSIGDYIWYDGNHNGIQEPAETGITGVTVQLLDASQSLIASTTSDGNGFYHFTNLDAGQYYIEVVPPANYTFTQADQGSGTTQNSFDSDVDSGTGRTPLITVTHNTENYSYDAGLYLGDASSQPASIGDFVWYDSIRNNIQDSGEEGVGGVTVNLWDATFSSMLASTTSDATGYYGFSGLPPGDYAVEFVPAASYSLVTADSGSDDSRDSDANVISGRTAAVTLTAGDHNRDLDAGLFLTSNAQPASLGNRVWFDTNKNGVQDAGETGLGGIGVELYEATDLTSVISSTVTDTNGNYSFNGLAANNYSVRFITNQDQTLSPTGGGTTATDSDADPTTGFTNTSNLIAGQHNPDIDAGIFSVTSPTLYTIGDLVWLDSNHSGSFDPGEGLAGITLVLYAQSGAPLLTTTTNSSGLYTFTDIPSGNYRVAVNTSTLPPDLVQLADPDATLDHSHELMGFNSSTDLVDFGYREHEVDVELTKSYVFTSDVDNNQKLNTGDILTFTISVTNKGPENANQVEVRDSLPAGYTLNGVSVSQGSYSEPLWHIGSLAVGDLQTMTMTVTVTGEKPHLNTAEVTSTLEYDIDSTPDNGRETEDDQESIMPPVQNFPWSTFISSIPPCPPTPQFCYMVSDRDSTEQHNSALLLYNFTTGQLEQLGRLGVGEVEAIALSPDGTTLYGINNGVFGVIDTTPGQQNSFSPINSRGISDGKGELGHISFRDIDGLSFDPTTGTLYGTARRGDDLSGLDMLLKIDTITGDLIKNGFGNGIDYVIIDSSSLGVFHTDDIAIDTNGTMYGVVENSGGGGGDLLVVIDKDTGHVTQEKVLRNSDSTIHDMEGLTFYFRSTLYGTTGIEFQEEGNDNSLFTIDAQSGQSSLVTPLDSMINGFNPYDFEAVSCPICK